MLSRGAGDRICERRKDVGDGREVVAPKVVNKLSQGQRRKAGGVGRERGGCTDKGYPIYPTRDHA